MRSKRDSGTAMFLMEMIAAVGFFILCASVCILVFVKADMLSRLARDTNRAALAAESVAEVWKAEAEEGLLARFGISEDGGEAIIRWDSEWNAKAGEETAFEGRIKITAEGSVETSSIRIIRVRDGEELFSLAAKRIAGR